MKTTITVIAVTMFAASGLVAAAPADAAISQAVGASAPGTTSVAPNLDGRSGSTYTASVSGTSSTFRFYASGGSAAQRFTAHVYATNSSGQPTTKLGTSAEVTVNPGQAAGWVSAALPGLSITAGTRYTLAVAWGPTTRGALVYYTPETGAGFWQRTTYPAATSTWGTIGVNDERWAFALDVDTGGTPDTAAPTTPGNLRSTAKTDTSVALAWDAATDNVGVTGYQVFRGSALVQTVSGTSYSDPGLTAGTAYTYTIKAVDAAGNVSAASNAVTVTTNPTPTGTTAAELFNWGAPMPASDEFNYGSPTQPAVPDQTKWSLAGGGVNLCWPGHAGNGQRCDKNTRVFGGVLRQTGGANGDSGWLASKTGRQYGRWEARVRSTNTAPSNGRQYHPLLIIWPDAGNWPVNGEYDYLENGAPGQACAESFIHYPHNAGIPTQQIFARETNCGAPLSQWHNIAFEWTSTHVAGFIDGREWFRYSGGANSNRKCIQCMPSGHQTIQLDNFYGSNMTPATYEVDWYREYRAP